MSRFPFLISFFVVIIVTPVASANVSFTWMGTTGTYFTDGHDAFLIDPTVTRPSLADEVFNRAVETDREMVRDAIDHLSLKNVRAVFVSHSHFDHALDSADFARQTGSLLIGSDSTANLGRGAHLTEKQIHTFRAGETIRIGAFKITVLKATHPPLVCGYQTAAGDITEPLHQPTLIGNYKMGGAFSFLIEHPKGKIYFHPTSRWEPGQPQPTADVLFVGIASRGKDQNVLDHLVGPTLPKKLIPLHFDDFFQPVAADGDETRLLTGIDLNGFLKTLKKQFPVTEAIVPYYGRPVRLF